MLQQWHHNMILAQSNDQYYASMINKPMNRYERLFCEKIASKLSYSGQ